MNNKFKQITKSDKIWRFLAAGLLGVASWKSTYTGDFNVAEVALAARNVEQKRKKGGEAGSPATLSHASEFELVQTDHSVRLVPTRHIQQMRLVAFQQQLYQDSRASAQVLDRNGPHYVGTVLFIGTASKLVRQNYARLCFHQLNIHQQKQRNN